MKKKNGLSLSDILKPEIVQVAVSARDREDAIRKAGEILVKHKIVEDRYIEAMLHTCEELGPYIVLVPGIAIPHAAPEEGAIGIGLAIITLSEPIEFGHQQNDPVDTVIAFASCDKDMHIEILSSIATFLQDKDRAAAVAKARSPEEVVALLSEQ